MPPSWFDPIDSYCERVGAAFWAEPLNALSNAAFILAAAYGFHLWRRTGAKDWAVLWLIAVTVAVGIGSFLFHTFANRWSLLADVVPIAGFIYSYFLLAMRRFLRLKWGSAIVATGLFVAFNTVFVRLWLGLFPGLTLNGSIGYVPAILALLCVGAGTLRLKAWSLARGLLAAAGVLSLSLFFRSIDAAVCSAMPAGTHHLWHILNGAVLLILMRTALASGGKGGTQAPA